MLLIPLCFDQIVWKNDSGTPTTGLSCEGTENIFSANSGQVWNRVCCVIRSPAGLCMRARRGGGGSGGGFGVEAGEGEVL